MQEELCCQKKVASSVLPSSGPLCLQVLGAKSNWLEIIYQVHFKDTESFMELGRGQKSTCEPHGNPQPSRKPAEIGSHFFSTSFLCSRFTPASFLNPSFWLWFSVSRHSGVLVFTPRALSFISPVEATNNNCLLVLGPKSTFLGGSSVWICVRCLALYNQVTPVAGIKHKMHAHQD